MPKRAFRVVPGQAGLGLDAVFEYAGSPLQSLMSGRISFLNLIMLKLPLVPPVLVSVLCEVQDLFHTVRVYGINCCFAILDGISVLSVVITKCDDSRDSLLCVVSSTHVHCTIILYHSYQSDHYHL